MDYETKEWLVVWKRNHWKRLLRHWYNKHWVIIYWLIIGFIGGILLTKVLFR